MKKINLLLRLLSKKGALILGVIVGLLAAFVLADVVVRAEETVEEEETTYILASGTSVDGGSWNVDVQFELIYKDIGNPLEHFCAFQSAGPDSYAYDKDKLVSKYEIISDMSYVVTGGGSGTYGYEFRKQSWQDPDLSWISDTGRQAGFTLSNCLNVNIAVYMFSSQEDAVAYLKGELDASNALNYDEIQSGGVTKKFDSTVPVPVNAYVSSITKSNVSSIFKYDESELSEFKSGHDTELYYEFSCDYLYQYLTKSQIESFSKSSSNVKTKGAFELDDGGLYDGMQLIETKGTCHDFYEVAKTGGQTTGMLSFVFTADTGPYTASGQVDLENAVSSSPPDYYDLYSQDLSFFSMEYHMQFIGVQISIDTYYCDESGEKVYSDTIYIRRFIYETLNDAYETTYTRVTHDDDGNDVFHSSYEQDANGNMTSGVDTLDTDNVLEYVKNGFGLAGKDGYLELLRRIFLGVPTYIWGIIAAALAINIIVIVFKVLRGM